MRSDILPLLISSVSVLHLTVQADNRHNGSRMHSKRSLCTRFSLSSAGFHFRLFTISAQMTRLGFPSGGPARTSAKTPIDKNEHSGSAQGQRVASLGVVVGAGNPDTNFRTYPLLDTKTRSGVLGIQKLRSQSCQN